MFRFLLLSSYVANVVIFNLWVHVALSWKQVENINPLTTNVPII